MKRQTPAIQIMHCCLHKEASQVLRFGATDVCFYCRFIFSGHNKISGSGNAPVDTGLRKALLRRFSELMLSTARLH